jgi:hypothetical protein
MRSAVVSPQPDGPTVNSPSSIARSSPTTASLPSS